MNKSKLNRHYLEMALYLLLLYGVSAFVFLNGDDFMYGTFAHQGILRNVWGYYFTGNGRLWINILDSALLWFDRYLFRLLVPLIVFAFIVLMAKNIQYLRAHRSDPDQEQVYIRWGMVLFASLDVMCLRETVFWITGMMNYLFPAVVFLWALLLFQQVHSGNAGRGKTLLFFAACLLAGSSVEQFALMFLGMMTLVLATDLFQKKRPSAACLLGFALALCGLAFLILAPGNFERVVEQESQSLTFAENLWTTFYQNTLSHVAFPYLLMFSLCAILPLGKRWLLCLPVAAILAFSIPAFQKAILLAAVTGLLLLPAAYFFLFRRYENKAFVLSLLFVGAGSQIMLLISPVWGFRCMFSMYLVYMLVTLHSLSTLGGKEQRFILLSGLLSSFHPALVLVFWGLCALAHAAKKPALPEQAARILLPLGTVLSLLILLVGYAGNAPTHRENLAATARAAEGAETIFLKELPDDHYSWYFIPVGDFHENYYRLYHGLPEDLPFQYQELEKDGDI